MKPLYKYAGLAGILTGIMLLLEFVFFMVSGFSPDKLTNPTQAIALVQDKELILRIAAFFGFAGAIVRILYVAGLAGKLQSQTPTHAAMVLYFGILGSVGHGLVALTFFLGLPALVALAGTYSSAAIDSWGAFLAITNGFQGLGNLLLGLMLALAGSAIIAKGELPKTLGRFGIIAGCAAVLGVVTTATPLAVVGFAAYIPSIVLAVIFDVLVGKRLMRLKG